jgi:hypothetical protein
MNAESEIAYIAGVFLRDFGSVPGSQFSKNLNNAAAYAWLDGINSNRRHETSPVRQLGHRPSWTPTRFAAAVRSAAEDSRRSREQSVPVSK